MSSLKEYRDQLMTSNFRDELLRASWQKPMNAARMKTALEKRVQKRVDAIDATLELALIDCVKWGFPVEATDKIIELRDALVKSISASNTPPLLRGEEYAIYSQIR